ncbi:hypothetical protein SLOPH_916, partial [Spraguea lophii 42_110]
YFNIIENNKINKIIINGIEIEDNKYYNIINNILTTTNNNINNTTSIIDNNNITTNIVTTVIDSIINMFIEDTIITESMFNRIKKNIKINDIIYNSFSVISNLTELYRLFDR